MLFKNKVIEVVSEILRLLVACDYDAIVSMSNGVRLSADQIRFAVDEYGCKLIMPPRELKLDIIEIEGRSPESWSVRSDLWTEEEGRSDLTLELTVIDKGDTVGVELDDIHVM